MTDNDDYFVFHKPIDSYDGGLIGQAIIAHAACLLRSKNPNLSIENSVKEVLLTYKKVYEVVEELDKAHREGHDKSDSL